MRILKSARNTFQTPSLTKIAEITRDPFKVLISCILSLRTKDAVTAKASARLYAIADDVNSMVNLDARTIQKAIYPVGFYKTKAKTIKHICERLLKEYGGIVPDTIEELLTFSGVGRKTANIVLVYGFNKKGLPIDIHCHRIPNRLGWITTKTPAETEILLRKSLPKRYWNDFNTLFVQFGQHICKPVSPFCSTCPISGYCQKKGVIKHR